MAATHQGGTDDHRERSALTLLLVGLAFGLAVLMFGLGAGNGSQGAPAAQLDRLPPSPRAPAVLDQVLLAAVHEAQPLRPEVRIRVTRLDEARLVADELRLRQLLVNLLDNALRVTPVGGEVGVELIAGADAATITVADEGPGIAPDQLERIFERFHFSRGRRAAPGSVSPSPRDRRAPRRKPPGAQPAGRGATFRLCLPIAADAPAPAGAPAGLAAH